MKKDFEIPSIRVKMFKKEHVVTSSGGSNAGRMTESMEQKYSGIKVKSVDMANWTF